MSARTALARDKLTCVIVERSIVRIRMNEDREYVDKIRAGILKREGYCPCKVQISEENHCMCREFRDQIADPEFEGYCHCRLYYKEL